MVRLFLIWFQISIRGITRNIATHKKQQLKPTKVNHTIMMACVEVERKQTSYDNMDHAIEGTTNHLPWYYI